MEMFHTAQSTMIVIQRMALEHFEIWLAQLNNKSFKFI